MFFFFFFEFSRMQRARVSGAGDTKRVYRMAYSRATPRMKKHG